MPPASSSAGRLQVDQAHPGHQRGAVQRPPAQRLVPGPGQRQRQRAVGRDRAAPEHHRRPGDQLGPGLQHLAERNLAGPVQHDAEGALVRVVLDDQDDGPPEVGVAEQRRGHEQPAAQGFIRHTLIMLRPGPASARPDPETRTSRCPRMRPYPLSGNRGAQRATAGRLDVTCNGVHARERGAADRGPADCTGRAAAGPDRRRPAADGAAPAVPAAAAARGGRPDADPAVRPGHRRPATARCGSGDLAAAERIAPSTLTRLVSALEERGYVERARGPRRRAGQPALGHRSWAPRAGPHPPGDHEPAGRETCGRCPPTSSPRSRPRCPPSSTWPTPDRRARPRRPPAGRVRTAGWTACPGPWSPAGHAAGRSRTGRAGASGPCPGPRRRSSGPCPASGRSWRRSCPVARSMSAARACASTSSGLSSASRRALAWS